MTAISKIEKSIASAKFIIKKKKEKIAELSRRSDLNQNQQIFIGEEQQLIQIVEHFMEHFKKGMNIALGKLPPQALDLEQSILGAIILEKDALGKVIKFLQVEHFYTDAHQLIYQSIVTLNEANEPIDLRTVVFKLREMGSLEIVGGAYYIAEITSKVSSSANVEFHSRILIELAIKRQLITLAGTILTDGYDDTKDCFEILDYSTETVKELDQWRKK